MSTHSRIEWTDHTWSPIVGCTKVGAGCANCYAIRHSNKLAQHSNPKIARVYAGLTERRGGTLNWTGTVRLVRERLDQPKSWRKPARIFVNPMSDLFHESLSLAQIHEIWCAMTGALGLHHTYQILTKRYARMAGFFDYLRGHYRYEYGLTGTEPDAPEMLHLPQPHIWLGHSYSNQREFDSGMDHLRRTPAAVRFVSLEPLLEKIKLCRCETRTPFHGVLCPVRWIDWVIVGFESGPEARPGHPQLARDVRDECIAAGIPFLFKQWGEWLPDDQCGGEPFVIKEGHPGAPAWAINKPVCWLGPGLHAFRVGKKDAGRLLDGREWMQFPRRAPQ